MRTKQILKRVSEFTEPFRVDNGKKFHLKDFDPGDTLEFGDESKPRTKKLSPAASQPADRAIIACGDERSGRC
jgi:hypothetical protein